MVDHGLVVVLRVLGQGQSDLFQVGLAGDSAGVLADLLKDGEQDVGDRDLRRIVSSVCPHRDILS